VMRFFYLIIFILAMIIILILFGFVWVAVVDQSQHSLMLDRAYGK
jgi:hypothetical protein